MSALKKTSKTKADCLRLINNVDLLLSTARAQLIEAKTDDEKLKRQQEIDMLLDERVSIMKVRDNS